MYLTQNGCGPIAMRMRRHDRTGSSSIEACGVELKPVSYTFSSSRLVLSYYFAEQDVCGIRVSSPENAGQDRMILSELSLGNQPLRSELPAIGSFITPVYKMIEPGFWVKLVSDQRPAAAAAMYRCADSASDVVKYRWVFDMLDPVRGDSRPNPALGRCKKRST